MLEDCHECQEILRLYKEKIMRSKNEKLKKFIIKYYELDKEELWKLVDKI